MKIEIKPWEYLFASPPSIIKCQDVWMRERLNYDNKQHYKIFYASNLKMGILYFFSLFHDKRKYNFWNVVFFTLAGLQKQHLWKNVMRHSLVENGRRFVGCVNLIRKIQKIWRTFHASDPSCYSWSKHHSLDKYCT